MVEITRHRLIPRERQEAAVVLDVYGNYRSRCSLIFYMEEYIMKAKEVEAEFFGKLQNLFLEYDATMEVIETEDDYYMVVDIPYKYTEDDSTLISEGCLITLGKKF